MSLRIANTLDCLFTVLLYLSVGDVEGNPLMGWLLGVSVPLFVVVKLVGVAALSMFIGPRVSTVLTVLFVIAASANAALLWVAA